MHSLVYLWMYFPYCLISFWFDGIGPIGSIISADAVCMLCIQSEGDFTVKVNYSHWWNLVIARIFSPPTVLNLLALTFSDERKFKVKENKFHRVFVCVILEVVGRWVLWVSSLSPTPPSIASPLLLLLYCFSHIFIPLLIH